MPALYHDNHAVRPPRPIDEGYHLSADLADRAIEFLGDLRAVDDRNRSSSTSAPGPATRRTTPRPSGSTATAARSTRAGTRGGRRPSPASSSSVCSPGNGALTPAAVGSGLGQPRRREQGAGGAVHGVLRRLPLLHRRADRTGAGFIDDLGDRDDTLVVLVSDNGASSEGGREGTINEGRLSNFDGPAVGRDAPPHRRDRRSPQPQQLPVGLDHGGQHAVQALEARGPRGWRRRPLHRPAPAGHGRGPAARPPPVRPRHRRAPTVLELVGVEAPQPNRRDRPVASRRHQLRLPARRRRRRRPGGTTPSTSRCSGRGPSTTTAGRRSTFHPVGPALRRRAEPNAPFDDDMWELYHVAEDLSEVHDLAAEHPDKLAELVALWWEEARRNDVLPLDNRVLEVDRPPQARPPPHPRHLPLLPGRGARARDGGRQRAQPLAPHDVRSWFLTAPSRRGAPRPRLRARRVVAARPRRPAPLRPQPVWPASATRCRRRAVDAGRHAVTSASSRTGRGAAGPRSRWTVSVGTEGVIDRFTPAVFNEVGIGLTCGYEWGPAVGEGYRRPSRSTAPSSGPRSRHRPGPPGPVAEIAAILSKQ